MKLILFILFLTRPSPSPSCDDLGGTYIFLLEEGPLLVVYVVEVVCSMNAMGVDFIVPVMIRSAWF